MTQLMDYLSWDEITSENLNFLRALSVDCLCVDIPPSTAAMDDPAEEFSRLRHFVEDHDLRLHVLHAGALPHEETAYGTRGREHETDVWCKVLRAMGRADVPVTATTFPGLGHFRTESTVGRGGALYPTWDYEEYLRDPGRYPFLQYPSRRVTGLEAIGPDDLWESMAYFIEKVAPVAAEAGVTIALHPNDPPIPEPLGQAARIVVSLDSFERIFEIAGSNDAVGMLFCQGCVAEMGEDVPAAIRRFGERDKIVYVHFRNIRGGPYKFQEVFHDEGDLDMVEAMRTYREVGFDGPFMMDHTPSMPGLPTMRKFSGNWAGRAYANGYIRGLIQAAYH
jgi:mannonate dehydratase